MSVLVTGGAGYIGSHMVLELLDRGETVIVIDNLSTGSRAALPRGVPLIISDIEDKTLLEQNLNYYEVDAIIHFAGSIIAPESVVHPLNYYHNNTSKTRTLIEAAIKLGVKYLIFSSTAAVYGIPENSPVAEDAKLDPISPYGTSKLMAELMLRDCATAHNLNYIALRYFNVAGADPAGRSGQSNTSSTHLIKVANQTALGQRPEMSVYGCDYPTRDGTCIRDYIHVSDLIRAHYLSLSYLRDGGRSQTFNCGYGRGFSVLEVINAVKKISGVDFSVKMDERRAGDPTELIACVDKIKSQLGWIPKYNHLESMIRHALNWEQKLIQQVYEDAV